MALSERYNNGKIDYRRLVELSKRVKDSLQELVRQHAFKVDAINEVTHIEKILEANTPVCMNLPLSLDFPFATSDVL